MLFGVASIVYAAKVNDLYRQANYVGAQEAANNASKYAKIGAGVGIVWYIIILIVTFATQQ